MLLMAAQHPLLKMDTKQLRFFCNVPEYPYVCVNDAQNLILAYTIFTLCVILKQSFIQAGRQKVAKTGEAWLSWASRQNSQSVGKRTSPCRETKYTCLLSIGNTFSICHYFTAEQKENVILWVRSKFGRSHCWNTHTHISLSLLCTHTNTHTHTHTVITGSPT